ncbi:YbhB/YbcL family Raf kinase inhibitor-like protein [Catenuloplanes japonicus]|uniref:YbhB/YbcL family Raf kinase inhibitor-like protein n=1 Tax=Catenuloplanes japonicus TaxID=33876 RepID=UPI0005244412|nr:YbhB/YbcL family Raf kinase inhibitor-like protein [Catenuloplanes japonicus]
MAPSIGGLLRRVRAGTTHSVWVAPTFAGPESIAVTSPDFADRGPLPSWAAAGSAGDNRPPALRWTDPPEGTAQLLLILEDTDVPLPRPIVHTVAVLPAELRALDDWTAPAVRFLKASFGRTGYQGPMPPPGHGAHHYDFSLFALDAPLPAEAATIGAVRRTVAGHVLARGRTTGTFER